jgi:demethylmenaquinone methyltransferase/2-methoxy-6-polyprenyl-1,4-benzoquinol methylase
VDDLYERQKRYYDLRAPEYDLDSWAPATAEQADDVGRVVSLVASLPAARTLDVACGTGFLTQHLRGEVTALDASDEMLRLAGERVPAAEIVRADVPPLPFTDGAFERVFSSHFYDHLRPADRSAFLAEAARVGETLVLVQQNGGAAHREGVERRPLRDGSGHDIYKVYFTAESLLDEVGGRLLFEGSVFLVVCRTW